MCKALSRFVTGLFIGLFGGDNPAILRSKMAHNIMENGLITKGMVLGYRFILMALNMQEILF